MIPIKLTLHNFMCYRDPATVDFSGLHLACLSGDNGHGKSALLDAMTWALWGRARSSQADELITLGETEMWVELEFALGPNRYRVLRSRERKGRSGKSDLQLQVWSPGGDGEGEFRPITEPTIRETEQRIVDLLRMDYETFINSAYLVQGKADEFTVKPPNQRKQILADILGLGHYDALEAKAKELARQHKEEVARLDSQIREIDAELAREPQYVSDLQIAQERVSELSNRLRASEEAQQRLVAEREQLLSQRRSLEETQARLVQTERDLAGSEQEARELTARLATDEALIDHRLEVEAGYRSLLDLRQQDQSLNVRLAQHVRLQEQASQLERQISQERHHLEMEQRSLDDQLARLRDQVERIPALQRLVAEARAERAELAEQETHQQALRREIDAWREQSAALRSENQNLKDEMERIQERLALLAAADATCPVCGQPLGVSERERVVGDYKARGRDLGDRHRANQAQNRALAEQVAAHEAAIAEIDRALQARNRWQRQEAQAEAQLSEAQQATAAMAKAQETRAALAQRLESGDYATSAQTALAEVRRQMAALAYDPAGHEAVRQAMQQHEAYQAQYNQLQTALARRDDLLAALQRVQSLQERWRAALAADQQRRNELQAALARLPAVEADLKSLTAQVEATAAEESRARMAFGAAQQRLDTCRAQAQRRLTLSAEAAQAREQQALYEELQAAFGKKGLQAMIIEAAIPEIEAEANRLLMRMTDGRMAVRMETQRETKASQELRETLEIVLSDELGSRDYALFSGGEAFRANFAIRIALSKLLARRAGAPLQTLIVDEGFGTQDAQGRERLVQALTAIQDDFERVLVITHIDELKDHFPAHIDVVKTPNGSQISVS